MINYIFAGKYSPSTVKVTGRRLRAAPGEGWIDLRAELHGYLLWLQSQRLACDPRFF
jgi:hypothetical protein